MLNTTKLNDFLRKTFAAQEYVIIPVGQETELAAPLSEAAKIGLVSVDISGKERNTLFALNPDARKELLPAVAPVVQIEHKTKLALAI